jgi:hypothetical protein
MFVGLVLVPGLLVIEAALDPPQGRASQSCVFTSEHRTDERRVTDRP